MITGGGKVISHMTGHGELALIVGSYRDQFGYGDKDQYTLLFNHNRISWYDEDKLTLVAEYDGKNTTHLRDLFDRWDRRLSKDEN